MSSAAAKNQKSMQSSSAPMTAEEAAPVIRPEPRFAPWRRRCAEILEWCRQRCGLRLSAWTAEKSLFATFLLLAAAALWQLGAGYGVIAGFDFPAASAKKWQAVFLVNNQVYFGHIKKYNRDYVVLEDVYYLLQVNQQLQPPQPDQPQLNLVKLGQELHGPEDAIFIPKERILFWENMKPDSQVVQAIESTRK